VLEIAQAISRSAVPIWELPMPIETNQTESGWSCVTNGEMSWISTRPSRSIAPPIMLTVTGLGWLLTARGVVPGVQWAWVLGLAALGSVIVFLEGPNKFSLVVGPSLIVAAILSILRQTGNLSVDTEVPLLTITFGSLWTLMHLLPLSRPSWFLPK
jgi:hypothetical protein